ncbi:MAG: DnaB-like helicase C-terminal domain-containing protein [Candidatus Pacebacteria bacterium]|nr:DnaB-like helicase C-terminal domain-containing protein [Candidatus Paceibacterota bacterium]
MKNPDKIIDVESSDIFAEHFGVPGHKYIFIAMMYLYSKQIKPTPMAIIEVLNGEKAKKAVDELGGLEYLTILEESNIQSDNLPIFIEKIKQSHTRKTLLNISDNVRDFVLSDKAEILNPSELISFAEQKIIDISVNTNSSEVYKMGNNTLEVLTQRAENPSQIPGLEVGWSQYDEYTNGAQPGDLIILCAESKIGKSITLTNWATKLAIKDQIPILYIDTEMNEREQEDRILANLTGIPHKEIVSGLYVVDTTSGKAEDKIARLKTAQKELQLGCYYHVYMPQFTTEKVIALTKQFNKQFGIKALFFDYIKIPSSQANFKQQQEYQALGYFTSGLKELAGILKIPILTACQANRSDLNTSNPDATNIGGSYRILQLASKLMFLVNKSEEQIAKDGFQNGNQQLIIKYQRNAASDCSPINIIFDKPIIRQTEV